MYVAKSFDQMRPRNRLRSPGRFRPCPDRAFPGRPGQARREYRHAV